MVFASEWLHINDLELFTGCRLCRRAPTLDDSMIRHIEPGGLESWRLAARMVIFIDLHGIEGSVVLGLMTGSAGTAMDVLVTCFSKMGGGSGRRGCKNRAQLVICRPLTELFCDTRFFSSFSPNVSKT